MRRKSSLHFYVGWNSVQIFSKIFLHLFFFSSSLELKEVCNNVSILWSCWGKIPFFFLLSMVKVMYTCLRLWLFTRRKDFYVCLNRRKNLFFPSSWQNIQHLKLYRRTFSLFSFSFYFLFSSSTFFFGHVEFKTSITQLVFIGGAGGIFPLCRWFVQLSSWPQHFY